MSALTNLIARLEQAEQLGEVWIDDLTGTVCGPWEKVGDLNWPDHDKVYYGLVFIDDPGLRKALPALLRIVKLQMEALEKIKRGTHEQFPTCMTLPNGEFGPPRTRGWEGWAREIDNKHKEIAGVAISEAERLAGECNG